MLKPQRSKMKLPFKTSSLADRIRETQEAADKYIDEKVAEIGRESPGIPLQTIRNIVMSRCWDCQCRGALRAMEQEA
jgi:hypothetical protein